MAKLLIIFLICLCVLPARAQDYAPDEWPEESGNVTEDRQQAPEEIREMVADPQYIEKPLEFPGRRSPLEAGVKAMIIPGWGHFYLERYNRAWLIAGVELALMISIGNSNPARYKNASETVRDNNYRQYETLSVLSGLIWFWSVFDATSIAMEVNRQIDNEEKKISFEQNGARLAFRYTWE